MLAGGGCNGCAPDMTQQNLDLGVSSRYCAQDQLTEGCVIGHCTLSAPQGAIPISLVFQLSELPVPPDLTMDAVGGSLCEITLPAAVEFPEEVTLTIALDAAPQPNAKFFLQPATGSPPRLVTTSQASASKVTGIVRERG